MFRLFLHPPVSSAAYALCALALVLLAPACHKRTATTTPKVLVPSIETEPRPQPETATQPPVGPIPLPEAEPPEAPPEAAKKPTRKPHKPSPSKPAAVKAETPKTEPAKAEKEKTASEAGKSGSATQITAEVPPAAAQSKTQNTAQLLQRSEAKLAGLGSSLNESEQAMAQQARSYIDQSGEALRAGDIERAYNLAMKASLLANELAK
jgi:outer membrane biosynthesis protein TonB